MGLYDRSGHRDGSSVDRSLLAIRHLRPCQRGSWLDDSFGIDACDGSRDPCARTQKTDVGRARDSEGRPKPARPLAAAIVMAGLVGVVAVTAANSASGAISEYGNVPWRSGGADYGPGGGNTSFDRFAEMQQKLIRRADIPVFQVTYGRSSAGSQPGLLHSRGRSTDSTGNKWSPQWPFQPFRWTWSRTTDECLSGHHNRMDSKDP